MLHFLLISSNADDATTIVMSFLSHNVHLFSPVVVRAKTKTIHSHIALGCILIWVLSFFPAYCFSIYAV